MRTDLAVVIDLNEAHNQLGPLTVNRPVGSVPFGAKFRLVDFPLSSAMHAGVNKVLLTLPQRCQSVLDHVRNGREWHMNVVGGGLFISMHDERQQIVDVHRFVRHANVKKIAVLGTSEVMNLDLAMLEGVHNRQSQPVTLLYQWRRREDITPESAVLIMDASGRARDVMLAKDTTLDEEMPVSLNAGIFDTRVLTNGLARALEEGQPETVRGILRQLVQEFGANTHQYDNVALPVHDVPSYFAATQKALEYRTYTELFGPQTVHSKTRTTPPAHFRVGSDVRKALFGPGVDIDGSVIKSVIFRCVTVDDDATIKHSVIMQDSVIGAGAHLENVILDKDVVVGAGVELIGSPERPIVIGKGERIQADASVY
jgi:glucose-1-phosphate adenylyltransferase